MSSSRRLVAEEFRERAVHLAARDVHLPVAIARVEEALDARHVRVVLGEDVRERRCRRCARAPDARDSRARDRPAGVRRNPPRAAAEVRPERAACGASGVIGNLLGERRHSMPLRARGGRPSHEIGRSGRAILPYDASDSEGARAEDFLERPRIGRRAAPGGPSPRSRRRPAPLRAARRRRPRARAPSTAATSRSRRRCARSVRAIELHAAELRIGKARVVTAEGALRRARRDARGQRDDLAAPRQAGGSRRGRDADRLRGQAARQPARPLRRQRATASATRSRSSRPPTRAASSRVSTSPR